MPERIFLTYTNATAVPYQGSVLGHHIVLNYIDANGVHHTLQGTPERKFEHNIDKLGALAQEELFSNGANNTDSPFKGLHVEGENTDSEVSPNQPHTMVAEGDDLSARWALMQDFANEGNSIGYEYRPVSQNSNSFAGGALQRAGFFGPGNEFPERFDHRFAFDSASGEIKSLRVPGFEAPLTNPINTATPMPFPLDTVAPSNRGGGAPERRGSIDGGSGSWGLISPSIRAAIDDPSARYLSRRTYSLSQGSPFDAGAPAATPAPPGGPLSLNDAYLEYRKRLDANQSRASANDMGAPAAPLVPSDDANFSGGLPGPLMAVAGMDPWNPDQLAPPPLNDELRTLYGADPLQPRAVQRRR